jgi:glucose/arabinose dehydrogenase
MRELSRRRLLAVSAAGAALATTGRAGAVRGGSGRLREGPTVSLEPVADGFTAPLGFESPAGVDRHYVVDQAGTVETVAEGGRRDEPFLDVTDRTVPVSGYTEQGLLGLAFHPEFPDEERCFVRYSAPSRAGTPDDYSHTFVLSEFRATPDGADPDSERTLLEIPEPQFNHNGGAVVFGPDGYLYLGVGDGGAGNDRGRGHVGDWYDAVPGGNGQDVAENLLGSVLRIDVDGRGVDRPYAIPGDNPLVGRGGLDEHYAWGFRNPWRLSFGPDGRLLVADVGEGSFEEVNLVVSGGNYGWNVREGADCFGADDCPDRTPEGVRGGEPLRDPVVEYSHDVGIAVIGGHVYRGSAAPDLGGSYVFGDWRGGDGGPKLFAATPGDGASWGMSRVGVDGADGAGSFLLAFGEDPDGELYVCTSGRSTVGGSTGAVHRVVAADGAGGTATTGAGTAGDTPAGDGGTTGSASPGFGPASALAGLGAAAAYALLGRRRERD